MGKNSNIEQKTRWDSLLGRINSLSLSTSNWFEKIAMIGLVGIIIATLIDVIGDKIFGSPIAAGTEVVYLLQVIAIAGALAATKLAGKHIRLEFVDNFPKKLKKTFNVMAALFGLVLFILLAWQSFEYAITLRNVQEVTAAARIPLFPFVFWITVCCIPLCFVLLKEILESFSRW